MDKNKIIIIALIVVILALAIGIFATMNGHAKEDSKLTITSNSTFYEGDSIEIMLTDLNNTPISNQTINVTISDENETDLNYSIATDENGIGTLKLNISEGSYTINCTYYGNEKYSSSNASKNITIEKEVIEAQTYYSDYSSQTESEPEYGSDSYVDKWDESQQSGSSWAYLHDQPVKTDDDGNRYKRMYDEDTGESYWYNMNQGSEE